MTKAAAYFDIPTNYSNFVAGTQVRARLEMAMRTYETDLKGMIYLYGGASRDTVEANFAAENLSEGWLGGYFELDHNGAAEEAIIFVGDQGTDLFRLVVENSSENWKIQRNSDGAGAWVDIGSLEVADVLNVVQRLDFHWNIDNATGVFEVSVNGAAPTKTFTGDTDVSADTFIAKVRFQAPSNTNQVFYIGHLVVDPLDTRKRHTMRLGTTSEATYQEAEGPESSSDEGWAAGSFGDFFTFDANQRQSFNMGVFAAQVTDSWSVDEVVIVTNAKANAEPSLDWRGFIRAAGTDYDASNTENPPAGHNEGYQLFPFENDPSTDVAWVDKSAVEAAELGVRTL